MKSLILCSLCILFASTLALADPVEVTTLKLDAQDDWEIEGWVEELSTNPWNPANQLIASQEVTWEGHVPCPDDYQNETAGTTVQIQITNMTTRHFEDLYYVGDVDLDSTLQTTLTNYDETVGDVSTGPAHLGLAFKIDSIDENTPLVYESMAQDNIFEPGEIWEFVIQEYNNTLGLGPQLLGSVGAQPLGAIAAASATDPFSSGSIITPEPATLCMFGLGGLLLRRKKSA